MIRLDALRTLGDNAKDWFRLAFPLICVVRYLSDRPIDWLFFWIGWKFLQSSTSYFFERNRQDKISHSRNNAGRNINENDSRLYLAHFQDSTTRRAHSTTAISELKLTSLPSVVLSDVAYYLHPRDVLNLDIVLRSGIEFRTSSEGSDEKRIIDRLYDSSVGRDIWKRLWYRDYGDVLLRWDVSREAFRHSLTRSSAHSTSKGFGTSQTEDRLEERLSKRLDAITSVVSTTTMKDFYFLFGECFIDYVLAKKNTMNECYLGLHGHIFDFTDFAEFHPGLILPILKECGGDATHYFEDLPHSSGARNIARRLCILVDHKVIDYSDGGNSNKRSRCGLELVTGKGDPSKLKNLLRSTNTRPLPATNSNKNFGVESIVPRRRKWRRHPTLERIRTSFQEEQWRRKEQQNHFHNTTINDSDEAQSGSLVNITTEFISSYSPFRKRPKISRIYFDPLLQEWCEWFPVENATNEE